MKEENPPSPPLQPLLFREVCLLLFAAGIMAARFPVPALCCGVLAAWVDSRLWRPACLLVAGLCMAAGWGMGMDREPRVPEIPGWVQSGMESRRASAVEGTVILVRGLPDGRMQCILDGVRAEDGETLPGRLALSWQGKPAAQRPIAGQTITGDLIIRPVHGFRNRDTGSIEDYWYRQGVFYQAWARDPDALQISGDPESGAALRERLREQVTGALAAARWLPQEAAAVIPALLFGDRSGLRQDDLDRINAAGLLHSLALSGQHLAIAGLGALGITFLIGLLVPHLFLRIPSTALIGLLSLPLAAGYLWLGGAPPSLVRAALMLAAACVVRSLPEFLPERIGGWLRTPVAPFDLLLFALLCMLLNDPLCLYDLSVQLSFAAVAGIALALPVWRLLWRRGPFVLPPLELAQCRLSRSRLFFSRSAELIWLTLGCSVAAQLATLPLVLDVFGRSTLWFPLNLLWLPVLGTVVLPLAFLGLILVPFGITLPLTLAAIPCEALLELLRWLQIHAGMDTFFTLRPHWSFMPGAAAIAVALLLRVNRPSLPAAGRRMLAAGAVLLAVGPVLWLYGFLNPVITLRVLDVGQGQGILLEWPHGGRILIDGGGTRSERFDTGRDIISPVLAANRPLRLDALFLSHPDQDHIRGLLFIASHYAVPTACTASLPGLDGDGTTPPLAAAFSDILRRKGIPRQTLHAGDQVPLADGLVLEILGPPAGVIPSKNNGLIIRIVHNGHGLALIPGDAERAMLRELIRQGVDLTADVLVLPHHGSSSNNLPGLYDAAAPHLAIASAGYDNPYHQPGRRVREDLARRHIPLHVTAGEGEINVRWAWEKPEGSGSGNGPAVLLPCLQPPGR